MSPSTLSPEVIIAFVEVANSWFPAKPREVLDELQLGTGLEVNISPESYGRILIRTHAANAFLGRIWKLFRDSRPPKKDEGSWRLWRNGYDRIKTLLSQNNLVYEEDGPYIGPALMPASLESALSILDSKDNILKILKEAGRTLNGQGDLEPQKAGSLLRNTMEAVHQGIVTELQKICSEQHSGSIKDSDLREYMKKTQFISIPEERFFTAIYSFISESAGPHHRALLAKKDTVLLIQSTLHNYFLLLLRRLREKKKPAGKVRRPKALAQGMS